MTCILSTIAVIIAIIAAVVWMTDMHISIHRREK